MEGQESKTEQVLITKDMMIGDIVEKYPQTAQVMQEYGLHCFGCHSNPYETLEMGTVGHGMSEDTLNEMLTELNTVAVRNTGAVEGDMHSGHGHSHELGEHALSVEGITLTSTAAKKVLEIMKAEQKEGFGLRVGAVPGGCSGFNYSMDFENKPAQNDAVFEDKGVKVYVDKGVLAMLNGLNIDYLETLNGAGFKLNNPNAHSTCGCGNSFA